jgi:glucose-1-phosphate thymidylyltransferase
MGWWSLTRRARLEITDVNRTYLALGALRAELWGRGIAWLDMGTHASLMQAANFIETVESRQALQCQPTESFKTGIRKTVAWYCSMVQR